VPAKRRPIEETVPQDPPMTPMIDVIFQLLIFFLLTLKFSTQEGKMLSHLPKDKGLAPSDVVNPEINEVRIALCADAAGGGIKRHFEDKGGHDVEQNANLKPEQTLIYVENQPIGTVTKSTKDSDKSRDNHKVYEEAAKQAERIYTATPASSDPTKKAPVKLDPDSVVPYEHVLGVLNALKRLGIDNVEFVGNPRLTKYLGPQLKQGP
jgi:biopolymer transport protein ExbD